MTLLLTQFGEMRENECSLVDFVELGEEAESIVECIHNMALKELLSRSIESMWDWELRTKNMFVNNHLFRVGDVAILSKGRVNRLIGCGHTTRKEVYDVFWMHHLRLKYWTPEMKNYKFED